MSGGHFDYNQYKIGYIADEVEQLIERNGKEIPKEYRDDWSGTNYYEYPPEVIEKFKRVLRFFVKLKFTLKGLTGWFQVMMVMNLF